MARADVPLAGVHQTLGEALGAAAAQFPAREAYIEAGRSITFGAWIGQADILAAALEARGIGRGDVVLIHLPSSIDYAICYAAAARLGAVASGLNMRLGATEIAKIVAIARPSIIIAHNHDHATAYADAPHVIGAEALMGGDGRKASTAAGRAGDPAAIIWTSGTTGIPKGAWFDNLGLAAAVDLAGPIAAPFDRRLVATPFAHAGYMSKLWEQVAFAITLVIADTPWTVEATAKSIAENAISVIGAVPAQWSKLAQLPDQKLGGMCPMRVGVVATAPASADMIRAVHDRFGWPLVNRYAMTECPAIAGTDPEDDLDEAGGTVGRPLPGVEIEIRDGNGQRLPQGSVGQVVVRAPCRMRGYWNAPDATAAAIDSRGWLHSGDLGYFDPTGRLVIAGRSSEMYIRGGYNVYPQEVEAHLARHPAVAQVCVVGLAAPVIGEIGVAAVVPRDPSNPPTLSDLRIWCEGEIADYKRPDELQLLDALPLTAMMKLDRRSLKVMLEASRPVST
jgi:acyl-CoA synthetase (AMP-forming)/AMP-acid ligase II